MGVLKNNAENDFEIINRDDDFVVEKKIYEKEDDWVVEEQLKMPSDLRGKKVLELFSGEERDSLKRVVEQRGGNYFSLDKKYKILDSKHTIADALETLPFEDKSFDFVVMAGPTIWLHPSESGSGAVIGEEFADLVKECDRILKNTPGSFVAIRRGFSEEDRRIIKDFLNSELSEVLDTLDLIFEQVDDSGIAHLYADTRIDPFKKTYTLKMIRV